MVTDSCDLHDVISLTRDDTNNMSLPKTLPKAFCILFLCFT